MPSSQLFGPVASDFTAINELIESSLHSRVPLVAEIAAYLVQAGGKRLRPLLVLLAVRSCGDSSQHPVKLAVAIEFLHTAMLLHDDVVDESTCVAAEGPRTLNGATPQVLVGDFLHSRAFELMVELGNIDVMALISKATNGIAEGEVQQLTLLQNTSTSRSRLPRGHLPKDRPAIRSFRESGAVLGGASSEAAAYREYGRHLGLAFQLMDDWLDYEGTAQDLGKNTGDDLAEAKSRYQSFSPSKQLARRTDESSSRPSSSQDRLLLRMCAALQNDMVE